MKRPYERTTRVADLIQKALAPILQQEISTFGLVTITSVTVSRDLSYAAVYVSVLLDDETKIKETIRALNREVKTLRFSLAKQVKLRVMPELKFVFDESTAHGFHISGLIDKATKR